MSETCETKSRPKTFKALMRSSYFWKPALSVIIGGTLGYLYYHFVGCASGSCGITSNPYLSVVFGSVLGLFVTNSPCRTC